MTKKDFQRVADAVELVLRENTDFTNTASAEHSVLAEGILQEFAERFSDFAEADNERFDRDRFFEACGF